MKTKIKIRNGNQINRGVLATILSSIALSAQIAGAGILAGPVVNPANGHTYYLVDDSTWTGAEASAVAMGGHLATIRSTAENDWVYSTFSKVGGPRSLWIGLTSGTQDGGIAANFYWITGETAPYRNWT